MLGYPLLILSIYQYFQKKYVPSILIFLFFVYNGLYLVSDNVLGGFPMNFAFFYIILISIINIKKTGYYRKDKLSIPIIVFLLYILLSTLNTLICYDVTLFDALTFIRDTSILLSYFLFRSIDKKHLIMILKYTYIITFVLTLIYIFQSISGIPIFNIGDKDNFYGNDYGGMNFHRAFNMPHLLSIFFVLSFAVPNFFYRRTIKFKIVYFIGLLISLCRTIFVVDILSILYSNINKLNKKTVASIVLLLLIIIPAWSIINKRFFDSSDNVIDQISEAKTMDYNEKSGTFIYRIAWVQERLDYILNSNNINKTIFGLGLMKEEAAEKIYKFKIGLGVDKTVQLDTFDIDYGVMVTRLGLLGSILWVFFMIRITKCFFRHRKTSQLMFSCFSILLFSPLVALSSSTYTSSATYIILFIILNINQLSKKNEKLLFKS